VRYEIGRIGHERQPYTSDDPKAEREVAFVHLTWILDDQQLNVADAFPIPADLDERGLKAMIQERWDKIIGPEYAPVRPEPHPLKRLENSIHEGYV